MKRFTDADKWSDPWFRKLSWKAKLVYLYILDNCDSAGVWEPDYAAADFQIGTKIPWSDALAELEGRIYRLPTNARLRVVKFIKFQYGKLSKDCRPHEKVFEALLRHGLDANDLNAGIPDQAEHTLPYSLPATLAARVQEEEEDKEEEGVPEWLKAPWGEWLTYRAQSKRKPYAALGAKKQIAALAQMGADRATAAINYSIRQNYQGIFEERTNGNHTSDQRPNSRRLACAPDYSKVKNHGLAG